MTRRGRLVVTIAVLAILMAVSLTVLAVGRAAAEGPQSGATNGGGVSADDATSAMVHPGDTAWSIAERVDPTADPRVTVDRMTELNDDLDLGELRAGQRLRVPVDSSS